ncbi:MAG: twin-arginine translocation signal domain-containing protein, partial [Rhodothermales bacterium]|nr:twin-arginine translocation signal domain-containing protein [Rhodothermales bacterium]
MHKRHTDKLPPALHRHGACLHHGHAHERDHAVWSRRDFLTRMGLAAAGTVLTVGNHTVSAFGQSRLLGALQQAASDRILVLIQMNGGNDGLNMVIPVENDIYYNSRPTIAIPKSSAFLLDNETGIHPAMANLESLWLDGQMAVVHNVGYENQTRSHFEGTVNWSTARDQGAPESTGWLARYLIN